ncbi:hypothetical protein AVEN_208333-1 [Araneus ventricosus]|uniref:Uncharacterized protein n=1 Tax=Araneus ventricosus TaxID=182803 RepID=A0A4Y2P173_ARAVE|nr:hypothetical protein AVEN_208333-1 [Araneus ventricosus]
MLVRGCITRSFDLSPQKKSIGSSQGDREPFYATTTDDLLLECVAYCWTLIPYADGRRRLKPYIPEVTQRQISRKSDITSFLSLFFLCRVTIWDCNQTDMHLTLLFLTLLYGRCLLLLNRDAKHL